MRTIILALFALMISGGVWGQVTQDDIDKSIEKALAEQNEKQNKILAQLKEITDKNEKIVVSQGMSSRILFMIGIGSSVSFDKIYQMPVVSPLDNNVKMEIGQRGKVSATFGISYTPYRYKIINTENPQGFLATKGISFIAFFNPMTLMKESNLEENFSINNFGLGMGYKSITGFAVYAVAELNTIKQPRQWFIDEFSNGGKTYQINGQIQNSFSNTDESIFRNKLIPYLGIKACYTFDIIKGFASSVSSS